MSSRTRRGRPTAPRRTSGSSFSATAFSSSPSRVRSTSVTRSSREGRLAKIRSHVVSRQSCAAVARDLELGPMLAGARRRAPCRRRSSTGSSATATCSRPCSRRRWRPSSSSGASRRSSRRSPPPSRSRSTTPPHACRLQDGAAGGARTAAAACGLRGARRRGPAHDRRFTCAAMIDGERAGTGNGRTKKDAEQEAARQALAARRGRRDPGGVGPRRDERGAGGHPGRPRSFLLACTCRAIRIRGFKSFPDAVEVRLEPGVAVVVGPNGSGKSNIADALIWAAGSLAPSELRAEKPDDVLFAGSASRPAADHCEVELLFDNEDGALPGVDFSEVSISRRLHRGGEGQYLVNGAHVRRTRRGRAARRRRSRLGDGLDRLAGPGRGDSREEAGGPARARRGGRRPRAVQAAPPPRGAEARTRRDAGRARPGRRGRGGQAPAAARAAGDRRRARGEARRRDRGAARRDRRPRPPVAHGEIEAAAAVALGAQRSAGGKRTLEALLAERGRAEEELAEAAGGREGSAGTLYRLRSAAERLDLRREAAQALLERLRQPPPPVDTGLRERAGMAEARAAALERAIAEREGLPPAARALAEEGASLALSLGGGRARARSARSQPRSALLSLLRRRRRGCELLEQARERDSET